jgi:lipoprotein-releasing system ATP-binding protein
MSESLYRIRGLGKVFNKAGSSVFALGGVNMDIFAGETLGVVGVSGSGKSTLLHIMGTLEPPTEGSVFYRGKDLFKQEEKELSVFRNSEIGFIFQFHYLLMEFTALENVMMPCLIDRQSFPVAKQKACDVLERVGLSERLSHLPGELSGGEQQRVAIARSMVMEPKVVLADEPTGNLDKKTGFSVLDLFCGLNEDYGVTVVMVTHNSEFAKRMKKTVRISDGMVANAN